MKIMHITHGLGGIQTYLEYILRFSDKTIFEYIIVAPGNPAFQNFCAPFAKYYPLKVKREVNPFADVFLLVKLIRLIKKEKPDLLHVHSAKGGLLGRLAARLCHVKSIYTPHGFSYLSFTGIKRTFFFMLECIARNWGTVLLAVSHSEANRAVFEIGYLPGKVRVILNSIYTNGQLVKRDYDSNYRIGMIGRLTYQKNPMLFMEIAEALLVKYPHLQFSILGAGLDDHLGTQLNDFISSRNLQAKINLLPWGNSNTSKNFIEDTDIFVMTSVFEGLPFSLLEAMAGECVCVVSKADGNSDVIQNNENGFACLSKEEFCNNIESLILSKTLREKFGKAGRKYIFEKHSIHTAMQHLQNLYKNL